MNFSVKLLTALAALIFTTVSVLWILGGKKVKCSTSMLIDAPPASVFPYLHEEDLCKQWVNGLVDISPVGTDAKIIGSRTLVTVELASGKSAKYENKIIRFEENEYYSTRGSDGLSSRTSIFKLEPKDGSKTYLTYRILHGAQGIGKLLAPFRSSLKQEDVEADANRLKSLIESQYDPSTTPTADSPEPDASEQESSEGRPAATDGGA